MEYEDFSITSAIPIWLGDKAVECQVLLEPGPATFILENSEDPKNENVIDIETCKNELELFEPENLDTTFDEPMDVCYSLDDLRAEGIDLSEIIKVEYPNNLESDNDSSWLDLSSASFSKIEETPKKKSLIRCPVCKKPWKTRSKLKRHFESVHKGMKYKLFNPEGERSALKPVVSNGAQCSICRKTFQSRETRDKHLSTFHKLNVGKMKSVLNCQVCQASCSSRAHLALHMLKEHSSTKTSGLGSQSNALVVPSFSLESPSVSTPKVNPDEPLLSDFPCCLCSERFHSRIHLETHTRMHTKEKPLGKEVFSCEIQECHASADGFKTNEELLKHVEACHAFVCSDCQQHFANSSLLAEHRHLSHGPALVTDDDPNLQLFNFDQLLSRQQLITDHFISEQDLFSDQLLMSEPEEQLVPDQHEDENEKPVMKPLGDKVLTFLEKHFSEHFSNVNGIACAFCRCTTAFNTYQEFIQHFHQNHPYRCPKGCNTFCKLRSSIRKHFNIHHKGEKAQHCESCLDVFVSRADVDKHRLANHRNPTAVKKNPPASSVTRVESTQTRSNVKVQPQPLPQTPPTINQPFKPVLPKQPIGVVQASKLMVMEVKETGLSPVVVNGSPVMKDGEKVFQCPLCEKFYHHPDSIRKHCRLIHNLLVINCRHCFIVFLNAEDKARHVALHHPIKSPSGSPTTSAQPSPVKPTTMVMPPKISTVQHSYPGGEPLQRSNPTIGRVWSLNVASDASSDESLYQCPRCERNYAILKSLRKHCRLVHDQLSVCACRFCKAIFTSQDSKEQHMASVHGENKGGKNFEAEDEGQELIVVVQHPAGKESAPVQPSSPEEFYGFQTPTKDIEKVINYGYIVPTTLINI